MSKETSIDPQSEGAQDDALAIQRRRNQSAIQLLREWMADESGYDEATWPKVKQTIEVNRLSDRERFDD